MSRKPSVAASRRFSCSESLFLSHPRANSRTKDPSKAGPKIFWQGQDVTPDPLISINDKCNFSMEDIFLQKNGDGDKAEDPRRSPSSSSSLFEELITKFDSSDNEVDHSINKNLTRRCEVAPKNDKKAQQHMNTIEGKDKLASSNLADCVVFEIENKRENISQNKILSETKFVSDLQETETIVLLAISGAVSSNEDPSYFTIKKNNSNYLEKSQLRQDDYGCKNPTRACQTYHLGQKSIGINTCTPTKKEVGCSWFHKSEQGIDDKNGMIETLLSALTVNEEYLIKNNNHNKKIKRNCIHSEKWECVLQSTGLINKLLTMERIVEQTWNRNQQIKYRSLPFPKKNEKNEAAPKIEKLFTFSCTISAGRRVTTACWHRTNRDVLAIGYAENKSTTSENGLIMLWSLRNPSFPEKVIHTESPVLSLDFSVDHLHLIAAGLKDGRVVVYDSSATTKNNKSLLLDSNCTKGRHVLPVWQVKWINHGADKSERLVTISSDGRILEWSTQKGLSVTPLMRLESPLTKNSIMSKCLGHCFDFSKDNAISYVAGADNYLYRCSRSHNEHHMSSIQGHDGPITKIKYSPFANNLFLTSSVDWTIKLWSVSVHDEIINHFTFHSLQTKATVNDISWSERISTIFASASSDGKLEVWDVSKSKHEPIVSYKSSNDSTTSSVELTTVLFGCGDDVLVTGDSDGDVTIFSVSKLNEDCKSLQSYLSEQNRLIDLLGIRC